MGGYHWHPQELAQLKTIALQHASGGTPDWEETAAAYAANPGPAPKGLHGGRSKDAIIQKGKKHWKVCSAVQPQNATGCGEATHSASMQEWEPEVSAQEGTAGTACTPVTEDPGMHCCAATCLLLIPTVAAFTADQGGLPRVASNISDLIGGDWDEPHVAASQAWATPGQGP